MTSPRRTRRSAKAAGARFERELADYLRDRLDAPEIDRLVKTGTRDRGDIGNVRDSHGRLISIECKNTHRLDLPAWTREAAQEAEHYGAHAGVVIHKRHGVAAPGSQWVTLTLDALISIITHTPKENQ